MELAWLGGWQNFKNMELTGFIFLCKKIETNLSKAVLGFLHFVIKLFKNISFIFSRDSVGRRSDCCNGIVGVFPWKRMGVNIL